MQLEKGSSVSNIVETLSAALNKNYRPRLASPDKCESSKALFDLQSIILATGNRKLAEILSRTMGLPSISKWERE